eukprot:8683415-Heterocapsa_arctica.AAC.1
MTPRAGPAAPGRRPPSVGLPAQASPQGRQPRRRSSPRSPPPPRRRRRRRRPPRRRRSRGRPPRRRRSRRRPPRRAEARGQVGPGGGRPGDGLGGRRGRS